MDLTPLQGLSNLTSLHLNSNDLTGLAPLRGLTQLNTLDLINNRINELPEPLILIDLKVNMDSLNCIGPGISLFGNPLEKPPPEIVRQGKEAMSAWFQSQKKRNKKKR